MFSFDDVDDMEREDECSPEVGSLGLGWGFFPIHFFHCAAMASFTDFPAMPSPFCTQKSARWLVFLQLAHIMGEWGLSDFAAKASAGIDEEHWVCG